MNASLLDFSLVRQCSSWNFGGKYVWEKDKNEICFKGVNSAAISGTVSDFSSDSLSVNCWLVMLRFAVHDYICF